LLRRIVMVCLLAATLAAHLNCNNDQKIIDRHQQMIDEEED